LNVSSAPGAPSTKLFIAVVIAEDTSESLAIPAGI
jgi:hypothetical protein